MPQLPFDINNCDTWPIAFQHRMSDNYILPASDIPRSTRISKLLSLTVQINSLTFTSAMTRKRGEMSYFTKDSDMWIKKMVLEEDRKVARDTLMAALSDMDVQYTETTGMMTHMLATLMYHRPSPADVAAAAAAAAIDAEGDPRVYADMPKLDSPGPADLERMQLMSV